MSKYPPSPTALSPSDVNDRRLSSIAAAVDWAKSNNLLGILLDADFLVNFCFKVFCLILYCLKR